MSTAHATQAPGSKGPPDGELRAILTDAIRYWERRRILYNVVLILVIAAWMIVGGRRVVAASALPLLGVLFVLAVLANVCYCAAYFADIPLQYSSFRATWKRWRWALWLTGTLFAAVIASYWIVDEILPFAG